MKIDSTNKNGSTLEIIIELSGEEVSAIQKQAAVNLSSEKSIPGFRAGKAPYDLVKKYLGAPVLEEEELLLAVKKFYIPHVFDNTIEVVGRPKVDLVSQEPYKFKVIADLFPEVTLGQWEKLSVNKKPVKVDETRVAKLIDELRESRATEALADKAITLGDRITMDFQVSVDNVVIDGGAAKDYSIIVGKGQLVPGFEDNLIGLKANEEKKFDIKFPEDYHKNLAGKQAQVKVTVKSVLERKLPEVNDEFAKNLGTFESVKELQDKLRENLTDELNVEENNRVEREMFESMLGVAKFTPIPQALIDSEIEQMIAEFSHGISHQGIPFEEYLQSLKKTVEDLKKEFVEPATKRVKVALIIKEVSKQEKLEATEEEVQEDIDKALAYHDYDEKIKNRVETADYRERVKHFLTNKKVVDWLKEKLVK